MDVETPTDWIRRRPLAAFSILACAISWLLWLPLVLRSLGVWPSPVSSLWHYAGAVGPIAAGLIVATACGTGARAFVGRILRWRVCWIWYVLAILSPLVLFGAGAVAFVSAGNPWPDFSLYGRSAELPHFGILAAWLFHVLTFGIGEEAGWRGWLLPQLVRRRTPLEASIFLTGIWAVWHVPAFFYRAGYTSLGPSAVVGWLFSLLAGSIILTWLWVGARGSVLIPALWHGGIDVMFTTESAPDALYAVASVGIMLWAVVVILFSQSMRRVGEWAA